MSRPTAPSRRRPCFAAFAREDKPLRFNFSRDIEGFATDGPFYNAGIFVLSDRLPGWREAKAWLLEASVRYADRVVMSEQAILNLWLQKQRIEPVDLLPEYNVFRHRAAAAGARVVHAVGRHKPWMDFGDEAWNDDYRHWLAIGGKPSTGGFGHNRPLVVATESSAQRPLARRPAPGDPATPPGTWPT